jgi:AcrR family transcriptional regulator
MALECRQTCLYAALVESARDRILGAAERLFYAHGLRAVGVDAIIAEAEVAKASFYKHFPSKDDLVLAFLERRDSAWRLWLRKRVIELSPEAAGRPLAVFDALAERMRQKKYRGCAFINSMVELADPRHAGHLAVRVHKAAVTEYFRELLAESGSDEALAPQFMLLVDGAVVTAVREHSAAAAESAKGIAAALLRSKH